MERPVDIAVQIAARLAERGDTLAVAESSSGGVILALLTDIPGASAWLRGGIVAYGNDAKITVLGVPAAVLDRHGAVSADTAGAMALAARELFGATWGLGETGLTGPQTGRRSSKPAGLSYLAVDGLPRGQHTSRVEQYRADPAGGRITTKDAFAIAALALLLDTLSQDE